MENSNENSDPDKNQNEPDEPNQPESNNSGEWLVRIGWAIVTGDVVSLL
jgi:hypothetical protein